MTKREGRKTILDIWPHSVLDPVWIRYKKKISSSSGCNENPAANHSWHNVLMRILEWQTTQEHSVAKCSSFIPSDNHTLYPISKAPETFNKDFILLVLCSKLVCCFAFVLLLWFALVSFV